MKKKFIDVVKQHSRIVLDTSIWISYIEKKDTKLTTFIKENLFYETSDKIIFGNTYNLSEIGYIICRHYGKKVSLEILSIIESVVVKVNPDKIFRIAADIKCHFPIALSDCFSIATGKYQNCPILFKSEEELSENRISEIEHKFNVEIITTFG
ncbi:MAG: PIN domain-containing protein [Candidatus Lokiarchaeota archaeon]|nr:PIN domain-containing protein [Candidatus Harpocratesius repetitus]